MATVSATATFSGCDRGPRAPTEPLPPSAHAEDFDAAWTFIRDAYAYFDQTAVDWERARELLRPRAAEIRDHAGFVLDLRDTPGGGDAIVARPLMGRLVSSAQPYQRHELPDPRRPGTPRRTWTEVVKPEGPLHLRQADGRVGRPLDGKHGRRGCHRPGRHAAC